MRARKQRAALRTFIPLLRASVSAICCFFSFLLVNVKLNLVIVLMAMVAAFLRPPAPCKDLPGLGRSVAFTLRSTTMNRQQRCETLVHRRSREEQEGGDKREGVRERENTTLLEGAPLLQVNTMRCRPASPLLHHLKTLYPGGTRAGGRGALFFWRSSLGCTSGAAATPSLSTVRLALSSGSPARSWRFVPAAQHLQGGARS